MDALTAGILLGLVSVVGGMTLWGFFAGYQSGWDAATLRIERAQRTALEERENELRTAQDEISTARAVVDRLATGDVDRLLSEAGAPRSEAPVAATDPESLSS